MMIFVEDFKREIGPKSETWVWLPHLG